MKKFLSILRFLLLAPAILLMGAEGGEGGNGGEGGGSNTGGEGGNGGQGGDGGNGGDQKLSMTQAEIDSMIEKRLARERKGWESKLEDEKKKAAMTEAERLKVEKDESDKKAAEVQSSANARIAKTEFKIAAQLAGIPGDRLEAAVKLADLSELVPDEKGEIPKKALEDAVKATIKVNPFLQGSAGNGGGGVGGGANPGGGGTGNTMNDFIRSAAGRK